MKKDSPATNGLALGFLRCEYLVNPQGIDVHAPRLSWEFSAAQSAPRGLRQASYHVQVASSPELLFANSPDLWDSGRVMSGQTVGIDYAGKALQRRDECYWRVRVWPEGGTSSEPSDWSEVAHWSMGLLHTQDWQAEWISATPLSPATTPHFGWRSQTFPTAEREEWVQIDLGETREIDGVRLWGSWPLRSPQGSCALLLGMEHLDGELKQRAHERLLKTIRGYGEHFATGSITTIFLLRYLADNGLQDLAYRMVMQPSFPSYGYIVDKGATAMWERFDSWIPELGINPHPMNNFNHMGLNSVFEWIFGDVVGLSPMPESPGYERFVVAPYIPSDSKL